MFLISLMKLDYEWGQAVLEGPAVEPTQGAQLPDVRQRVDAATARRPEDAVGGAQDGKKAAGSGKWAARGPNQRRSGNREPKTSSRTEYPRRVG